MVKQEAFSEIPKHIFLKLTIHNFIVLLEVIWYLILTVHNP